MRPGPCWCATLFCAMVLAAMVAPQEPHPAKPQWNAADLASTDTAKVAWAAHHAGASGDVKLVAPLRKAVASWAVATDREGQMVCLHLLDALVRLQAKVPASELTALVKRNATLVPALLLLTRDCRLHESELLELFRASTPFSANHILDQEHLRTLAIGNLLAAQKAAGFAACIWQQADLDLHVAVVADGVHGGSSIRVQLPARASSPAIEGFPPDPAYRLVSGTSSGTLLAHGEHSVSYVRGDGPTHNRLFSSSQAQVALEWLQDMAGAQIAAEECSLVCTWSGKEVWLEQLQGARRKLQERKAQALRALVKARAMTQAEADVARIEVEVLIADQRKDKSQPLPELPPDK